MAKVSARHETILSPWMDADVVSCVRLDKENCDTEEATVLFPKEL